METYGHGQCDGLPVTQLIMPPDTGDRAGARRERVTPTGTRGELHARSGGVFLLSGSSALGVRDRVTARRVCWGGRYGLAGTSRISSSGQQKLIEAKGAWDHNNRNHFICSFFTHGQTFVFLTGAGKSGARAPSGKCDPGLTHTHLNSLPT